jgi:xanthine dehydrogenase accessory factor
MSYHSTDRDVLETAEQWLAQGQRVALVTVLKTWGSSPRPVGSLMVMRSDGIHHGSVSGGCVEEDLVGRYARGELTAQLPTIVDYGVNRQEATRFGLPCGGRLELLVESLEQAASLQALLQRLASGELLNRRVCLNTGEVSVHRAGANDQFVYDDNQVIKVLGPAWQLLLIGAGHLSRYVAQIALTLDYQVIICDPRDEYARGWSLDEALFTTEMPDDAVKRYCRQPRSAVITLTHDPKLDDMALMEALTMEVFYVGALGSKANNDKRRERLRELGVNSSQLQQLHAPVGLPIGSHTPPEIALSIMAELTAVRRGAVGKGKGKRTASAA